VDWRIDLSLQVLGWVGPSISRRLRPMSEQETVACRVRWREACEQKLHRIRPGYYGKVVIRDIKRLNLYPDPQGSGGVFAWYRAELIGLYHRGLEIILSTAAGGHSCSSQGLSSPSSLLPCSYCLPPTTCLVRSVESSLRSRSRTAGRARMTRGVTCDSRSIRAPPGPSGESGDQRSDRLTRATRSASRTSTFRPPSGSTTRGRWPARIRSRTVHGETPRKAPASRTPIKREPSAS
jgi:hypothetical protein